MIGKKMLIKLIAHTYFNVDEVLDLGFNLSKLDSVDRPESLIEFAGRNCYQSWDNPGKKSTTNYIQNVIRHGHFSVIEHVSASFYIGGISRACSHEIVRHRHFSYSQKSTRFCDESESSMVWGELNNLIYDSPFERDVEENDVNKNVESLMLQSQKVYKKIYDFAYKRCKLESKVEKRKYARQMARYALPNALTTSLVMTSNLRTWRHFIDMRANEHADWEIRQVALEIGKQLKEQFPAVFDDYTITNMENIGLVMKSSLAEKS